MLKSATEQHIVNLLNEEMDELNKESSTESYDAEYTYAGKYKADPLKKELAQYINDNIYGALDNIFISAISNFHNLTDPGYVDENKAIPQIAALVDSLVEAYFNNSEDISPIMKIVSSVVADVQGDFGVRVDAEQDKSDPEYYNFYVFDGNDEIAGFSISEGDLAGKDDTEIHKFIYSRIVESINPV